MKVTYLSLGREIISSSSAGVVTDLLSDPLGSISKIVDNQALVTDRYIWWPFGESLSRSGLTTGRLGYGGCLGYYTDDPNNRLYIRARSCRPPLTSWQQNFY